MTKEQINKIEHSFKHGDCFVFTVGERVFVAFEGVRKYKKEATIQMMNCDEVDESCFDSNGDYNGDTKGNNVDVYLADPYADYENQVASHYYDDELIEVIAQ